uniref:Uncharacterized protein n=1 Tax=Cacopsylla melanoneura TaxID=428564 RepID=A0A8D8UN86_9HEMI
MLRSYEERHSLVFSLAHFPFKQFKELSLADFLTNGKSLKPGVPLTDIPVMAFYTKHELDELKPFFKFFYMGDLEVTSNSVSSNRKSSVENMLPPPMPIPMQAGYKNGETGSLPNIQGYKSAEPMQGYKSAEPIMGYPYANRLPSSHAQKHSFFLAPVPVIIPKQEPSPSGQHHDNLNHNILNRSPSQESASTEKTAADLPVYSYKGVPLYIPRGRQTPSSTVSPGPDGKSFLPEENSLPGGISSTESSLDIASPGERVISSPDVPRPQPYSAPSGLGASSSEYVSLVFPSSPKPNAYSLPSGYGGIEQHT